MERRVVGHLQVGAGPEPDLVGPPLLQALQQTMVKRAVDAARQQDPAHGELLVVFRVDAAPGSWLERKSSAFVEGDGRAADDLGHMARVAQAMTHVAGPIASHDLWVQSTPRAEAMWAHASRSVVGTPEQTLTSLGAALAPDQREGRGDDVRHMNPVPDLPSVFEEPRALAGSDPSGQLGDDRRFAVVEAQAGPVHRGEAHDVHGAPVETPPAELLHVLRGAVGLQGEGGASSPMGRCKPPRRTPSSRPRSGRPPGLPLAVGVSSLATLRALVRVVGAVHAEAACEHHGAQMGPGGSDLREPRRAAAVGRDDVLTLLGGPAYPAEAARWITASTSWKRSSGRQVRRSEKQ